MATAALTGLALFAAARTRSGGRDPRVLPRDSYAGPNGHVMVVVRGGDFMMGSPPDEPGRSQGWQSEAQHRVEIPRVYAIATTEVTNEQFARFLAAVPDYAARWRAATAARFKDRLALYSRTPDSPQVGVSWYDAARYCNWLSQEAGLPENQLVYPEDIDPAQGLELPPDYLHRTGYRLPAPDGSRMGVRCESRHNDELVFRRRLESTVPLRWYDANTHRERMYPVAQLLPNQWGLFDMAGNAWEWTFDRRRPYPLDGHVTDDVEDSTLRVSNDVARTRRGGSFAYEWFTTRSAHRGDTTYFPNQTRDGVGFRVARTMPNR